MDGIEATRHINELRKQGVILSTPVIALSAEDQDESRYLDLEFTGSAPKPISRIKFNSIISQFQERLNC